jgi:Flp pilus assembly protein TadG
MFIQKAVQIIRKNRQNGQSFVELAIALPIVLLILLGLVEVVFFIARYLDVMDLTREAARFASLRSSGSDTGVPAYTGSFTCADQSVGKFNFYYHTACLFAPATNSKDASFKYTANDLVYLDQDIDDVLIQVFSVTSQHTVTAMFPDESLGPWALSEHDNYTSKYGSGPNWKRDCKGQLMNPAPQPHFTKAFIESQLLDPTVGPGTPVPTSASPRTKVLWPLNFSIATTRCFSFRLPIG